MVLMCGVLVESLKGSQEAPRLLGELFEKGWLSMVIFRKKTHQCLSLSNSYTYFDKDGDNTLYFVLRFQWKRAERSIALYIVQDPMRKRPYA